MAIGVSLTVVTVGLQSINTRRQMPFLWGLFHAIRQPTGRASSVSCRRESVARFPRVRGPSTGDSFSLVLLICRTYSFKMTLTSFRKAQRSPLCRHLEWARYKYSLTLHYIYWHLKNKMQISNFPK